MTINWGLAYGNGAQNALAQGLQIGQMARQRQEQRQERNALAAYAKDPSEANFAGLADVRPDIAIQQRQQMEARQAESQMGDLTRRAVGGDEAALNELAALNFDRWQSIDTNQKKAASEQATVLGNAALDVLNLPPEQRSARIMGYAQQFNNPEIAQIAQLPAAQQEQALRAAVAESGMVQRLIEMERPSYMAIPAGGTLVNTRSPQAVTQFARDYGNQVMTYDQYAAMVRELSPAAARRQVERLSQAGVRFSVSTPEEARQLPSGTQIILPDGSAGVVP